MSSHWPPRRRWVPCQDGCCLQTVLCAGGRGPNRPVFNRPRYCEWRDDAPPQFFWQFVEVRCSWADLQRHQGAGGATNQRFHRCPCAAAVAMSGNQQRVGPERLRNTCRCGLDALLPHLSIGKQAAARGERHRPPDVVEVFRRAGPAQAGPWPGQASQLAPPGVDVIGVQLGNPGRRNGLRRRIQNVRQAWPEGSRRRIGRGRDRLPRCRRP